MGMRNLPKPAGAVGHGPFAHHPLQVACAVVVAVSVQARHRPLFDRTAITPAMWLRCASGRHATAAAIAAARLPGKRHVMTSCVLFHI
eukprot:scaffold2183_cov140-Isochrysis_galbana.AAC.14